MWPIIPTSFPPTPWVKKNRRLNIWKPHVIVVPILHILIPDKRWMGKHLLWSLDIIQELIWKVWQNFGVFGVHQPLHIPHFVLWKAIHLTSNPWQALSFIPLPSSQFMCICPVLVILLPLLLLWLHICHPPLSLAPGSCTSTLCSWSHSHCTLSLICVCCPPCALNPAATIVTAAAHTLSLPLPGPW